MRCLVNKPQRRLLLFTISFWRDDMSKRLHYKMNPPSADGAAIDVTFKRLLSGIFPQYRNLRNRLRPTGKLMKMIEKKKLSFCQFTTMLLIRNYRKWLSWAAQHYLCLDDERQWKSIRFFADQKKWIMHYNCPPRSCRYYISNPLRNADGTTRHPFKCRSRTCPHCHLSRAFKVVKRVRRALKTVRSYYNNLTGFLYHVTFPEHTSMTELSEFSRKLLKEVKRDKGYFGAVWYFRPMLRGKGLIDEIIPVWQFRLLVIGSGSFDIDMTKLPKPMTRLRAWPIEKASITHLVAKVFTWGKYPFYYTDPMAEMWNQYLTGKKAFGLTGALAAREGHAIFKKFYDLHGPKRKRKKLLFGAPDTTQKEPLLVPY